MKGGRAVVVDADVARRARDQSPDADAAASAAALTELRRGPCRVAMSAALWEEWRRHKRRYATQWLAGMFAEKRIVRRGAVTASAAVRAAIATLPEEERPAAEKDLHLVELALDTDERVLSFDDKARRRFARLAPVARPLHPIHWVSPVSPGCAGWLAEGAPERDEARLGAR